MNEIDYINNFSKPVSDALQWLERQTHLRTNHARMLSGPSVGSLLALLSKLTKPLNILELGVFTGYSTICLAQGLTDGGMIHSIEINDELEDLILAGYQKAGISNIVDLRFGDAKSILRQSFRANAANSSRSIRVSRDRVRYLR